MSAAALCSALALWVPAVLAQPPGPTDPQIAAIVVTANQVDIDAGKLAVAKANAKEVKAFAQQMIKDHTGVNKQATELVTKLNVKPEQNETLLIKVRPAFVAHLEHAQSIQARLGK